MIETKYQPLPTDVSVGGPESRQSACQCLPKVSRVKLIGLLVVVSTFIVTLSIYLFTGSNTVPPSGGQVLPPARVESSRRVLQHDGSQVQSNPSGHSAGEKLHYNTIPSHHEHSGDEPTPTQDQDSEHKDKIRYKHTNRYLPQCLIIGVRKAGTRALLTFLNLHPQIQVAGREIHFFDSDVNYDSGLEWYRKKMPYSFQDQVTIEKTPGYFSSPQSPERIRAMNSSIKLLLIVRDPVERAVSDHLQITIKQQKKGLPTQTFEELAVLPDGQVNADFPPLIRSIYWNYMRMWLDYFTVSQFHLVDGDKLVSDPVPEIQAVERFLGLEHKINHHNFYFNKSRGFYCIRNETMEKCLSESKGRKHPPLDPRVLQKLQDFFRSKNKRFFRMVHREFDWG